MVVASEHLDKWLVPLATRFLPGVIKRIPELIKTLRSRDFLLFAEASVLALVVVAFFIAIVLSMHLVIGRRRALVFVSFQHDREAVADRIVAEMLRSGLSHVKLPFVENPDHDTLLDQVRQAVRGCDVFVCVPGRSPSFVESEVSMAFGLQKPMLFVVSEADTPRLPNTAKKGYPIFSLERLEPEAFRHLIAFSSYVARDWSSTLRLYGAVFSHLGKCSGLLAPVYVVSLLVALGASELTGTSPTPLAREMPRSFLPWIQSVLTNPAIYCFIATSVLLFLVVYCVFFVSRNVLRTRIRLAISTRKFSETFLPETLEYSLTKAGLLEALFRAELVAEHELVRPVAQHG
jgi:hypothetical protein